MTLTPAQHATCPPYLEQQYLRCRHSLFRSLFRTLSTRLSKDIIRLALYITSRPDEHMRVMIEEEDARRLEGERFERELEEDDIVTCNMSMSLYRSRAASHSCASHVSPPPHLFKLSIAIER